MDYGRFQMNLIRNEDRMQVMNKASTNPAANILLIEMSACGLLSAFR